MVLLLRDRFLVALMVRRNRKKVIFEYWWRCVLRTRGCGPLQLRILVGPICLLGLPVLAPHPLPLAGLDLGFLYEVCISVYTKRSGAIKKMKSFFGMKSEMYAPANGF